MEQAAHIAYRFSGFRLDPARRLLFGRDGQVVPLKPKAFDTLLYFIEHRGALIERRKLLAAVWPHVVVEENNLDQAISSLRRVFGETRDDHRFIVTEPGRGYRFVAPVDVDTAREISVAVLPFVSINGAADEYFGDGLTDELISRLGRVPDLKVAALTSSRFFKDRKELPATIAKLLGVRYLLEGSVRLSDDRLRVRVRLLEAERDKVVWQQAFDRERVDLIWVQDQISTAVVERLEVVLRGDARARFAHHPTENPEAQHLYFLAKSLSRDTDLGKMNKAIEYYDRATQLDPKYALAFVGWADTVIRRAQPAEIPSHEAVAQAHALLHRALDADPDSAEAHAILAFLAHDALDCEGARVELAAAELGDPSNVDVLIHQSRHHFVCDWDPERALDYARRAAVLDPLNPWAALHVMLAYYHRFEFTDALREVDRLVERFPDYWIAHWSRWWILEDLGRYEEALEAAKRTVERFDYSETKNSLAIAYARVGRLQDARAIYKDLADRGQYLPPTFRAMLFVALGDHAEALDKLEEAHQKRDSSLLPALHMKIFLPLHGEARFEELVDRLQQRAQVEALVKSLS